MYRAMPEEESISQKKRANEEGEARQGGLFFAKYLTMKGVAWRKPQVGNCKATEHFWMKNL